MSIVFNNKNIKDIYYKNNPIKQILYKNKIVWEKYRLELIYQHYGSSIDKPIPFKSNQEYLFKMEKPTWLIYYTNDGARNTLYVTDKTEWTSPNDLERANFYDKDQEYRVYKKIVETEKVVEVEEVLIFNGRNNRENLNISGGKKYRFEFDGHTELIYKVNNDAQKRISFSDNLEWNSPHNLSFAYINDIGNLKIYELKNNGGGI